MMMDKPTVEQAVEEAVCDEWQPIETAPSGASRNGKLGVTWLMLSVPDGEGGSHQVSGMRVGNKYFAGMTFYCGGPYDGKQFEIKENEVFPTHWRPLLNEPGVAKRKANQGKEWVDGLPPVGVECECLVGGKWESGESVGPYMGGWLCMLSGSKTPFIGSNGDFRPIQSGRDKAIEEMHKAYMEGEDASDHRGGIQAIYDAGYRKRPSRSKARDMLMFSVITLITERADEILNALGWERDA